MQTLDVFLAGRVLPGADTQKAVAALAEMVDLEPDKARALLCSGRQRLARRGLSPEAAQALVDKFAALGIAAFAQAHGAGAPPAQSAPQAAAPSVRRLESIQPDSGPETGAFNPYAAPRADLHSARRRDEDSRGIWRDIGRSVPAGHGIRWCKDAWHLVSRRPGVWIGAWLLLIVSMLILGTAASLAGRDLPPVVYIWVANAIPYLFALVFTGGMVLMADRQMAGEAFGAMDAFAGFRECPGRLLLLGVLLLVVSIAVTALADFVGQITGQVWLEALLSTLLLMPLSLAGWSAPVLVAVAGFSPTQALARGLQATLRNLFAILLNGLVLCGIPALVGIAAAILVPQAAAGGSITILVVFMLIVGCLLGLFCLRLLLIGPAMIYLAVRDMFYEE